MNIDANGYPLGFKVRQGAERSGVVTGKPGSDTFVVDARQVGHHSKEAVVGEGARGSSWRLASDEGAHLKGTDLAPFPLGFYNAGMQSDLAGRLSRLAQSRDIVLKRIAMTLKTEYSLTGSFVQGTGQGVGEAVRVAIDLDTAADSAKLANLIETAIAASPAFAMLAPSLDNTFALYVNGRRRNPSTLPASAAADAMDPYLKYAKAPAPLSGAKDHPDLVVKTNARQDGTPVPAPVDGKIIRQVVGGGEMLGSAPGLYRSSVALNLPGSTHFAYLSDETAADRAPSGLGLLSAGIAFCYMTQISRYIENMKLAIRAVRLVQYSPYGIAPNGRGICAPCDTHLFMQGEADEATFEKLQLVAANTCYLHQTMVRATPLHVSLTKDGKPV